MRMALTVLVIAALAGCSTAKPVAVPSATAKAPGANCPGAVLDGEQVRFGKENALAGALIGEGKTGLILAHMAPGSLCEWLPYGRAIAERGYKVLAFDFNGAGSSAFTARKNDLDVAEAVMFLRQQGVSAVVLMGASRGGTAVVTAGSKVDPPVNAVVSLSAPAAFAGMDAREAAAKLAVPVLYVAAELDGTYAEQAKELYELSKGSKDRRLTIVAGSIHGVPLMVPSVDLEAGTAVTAFLKANVPS